MRKPKTDSKKFSVSMRVTVEVGMEVAAKDFEEALMRANEFKLDDLVELHGDHNDSNKPQIISIWDGTIL
jgi:hypothetical protein